MVANARMIRSELLQSERVCAQTPEGRWLYVSIMLKADDFALCEASTFLLAQWSHLPREYVDDLLLKLADADLVRIYHHDGKRHVFVPRFGQVMDYPRPAHPLPERSLLQGDPHALALFDDFYDPQRDRRRVDPVATNESPQARSRRLDRERTRRYRERLKMQQKRPETAQNLSVTRHARVTLSPEPKLPEISLESTVLQLLPESGASRSRHAQQRDASRSGVTLSVTGPEKKLNEINGCHAMSRYVTLITPIEVEVEQEQEKALLSQCLSKPASGYRPPPVPYEQLRELWNSHPELPKAIVLGDCRRRAIRARWTTVCNADKLAATQALEFFGWFFDRIAASPFLTGQRMGRDGRSFRADIDFAFTPSKFDRIVEGRYDDEPRNIRPASRPLP